MPGGLGLPTFFVSLATTFFVTSDGARVTLDRDVEQHLPSCNCVNPNAANVHELSAIRGITQDLAMRIILGRTCFYQDEADFENKINAQGRSGPERWPVIKQALQQKLLCVSCQSAADVNQATAEALGQVAGLNFELGKVIVQGRSCRYKTSEDLLHRVAGSDYASSSTSSSSSSSSEGGGYAASLQGAMSTNDLCSIFGDGAYDAKEEQKAVAALDLSIAEDFRTAMVNAREVESDVAVMVSDEPKIQSLRCAARASRATEHLSVPELEVGEEPKEVRCDEGFVLSDDPKSNTLKVSCGADGQVKGLEGKSCVPVDCGNPLALFGGQGAATFEGKTTFDGQQPAQLNCKDGYSLDGRPNGPRTASISCLPSRVWSETGLTCLNTLCGGSTSKLVSCPKGASFDGMACSGANCAMNLTCGGNGWEPAPKPCIPVACPIPDLRPLMQKGVAISGPARAGSLVFREQVGFSCSIGHTFDGTASGHSSRTYTCGADGKLWDEDSQLWTGTPSCQPVKCGDIRDSPWWLKNEDFYSILFPTFVVASSEYGGAGATMGCRFASYESSCMHKYIVDRLYNIVGKVGKQKQIPMRCGPDGHWLEPTSIQTQTCAYPISPKKVRPRGGLQSLLPSKVDGRALTLIDEELRIEMRPFDRYNTQQHWVLDPYGFIRSAHNPTRCLTGLDVSNTWLHPKSKWLEDYLYVVPCNVPQARKVDAEDVKHGWQLDTSLATKVREGGAKCRSDESCCSLTFKALSKKVLGLISTGAYYATFPQPEGFVTDWMMLDYFWHDNGNVYEHWEDQEGLLHEDWKGKRVDGTGAILRAPRGKAVPLKQNFYMQNDPYPKVLKSVKMSPMDSELAIVDFWMA